MITLPPLRQSLPWHAQLPVRAWALRLFRFASRRRSYHLRIEPGNSLAWVDVPGKVVFVNTAIPETNGPLRCDPGTPHARSLTWLSGLVCHEAGHVRHSLTGPAQPTVFKLWNALEDERMERLMAAQYPELAATFTYVGDLVSAMNRHQWRGAAHEGVLLWRFEHDRDVPLWAPNAGELELWTTIRPLVEAAWSAPSSRVVEDLAWDIARLLGLPVGTPPEAPPTPGETAEAGGAPGTDSALPSSESGDAGKPDVADQAGAAKPHQHAAGDEPAGDDSSAASGADNNAPDAAVPDNSGDGEAGGAPEVPDTTQSPATANGGATPPVPDDGLDHSPGWWDAVVSASGAGQGEAEDRDPAERTPGGAGVSTGGSALPIMPLSPPGQLDLTVNGVEGYARRLAPLLRPREAPGRTTPHRSRGEYSPRRELRGREKVFLKRTQPGKPRRIFLDLLLDVSSSMEGAGIKAARETAAMIVRAASLCGARIRVTLFNDAFRVIIDGPISYLEAMARVQGLQASGGTELAPALSHLLSSARLAPEEVQVLAVLCDGHLSGCEQAATKALVEQARGRGVRFIPILLGPVALNAAAVEHWTRSFGHTQACPDVGSVARMLSVMLVATSARLR